MLSMHILQLLPVQWLFYFLGVFLSFVFFKKYGWTKHFSLGVLLFFSIIPLLSIFRPGTYESGDLSLHVIKSMDFYQSLSEGVLFPRWAGQLNAGYGYPHFIYAYPLPYYLVAFLHWIGCSFLVSTKLVLASAYLFSGLGMYWWISRKWHHQAGLVAALFYLFAPYHLVDLHFRAAIGEVVSFVFLPVIGLAIDEITKYRKQIFPWLIIGGVSYGLLILSHQATAMFATIFLGTYMGLQVAQTKNSKLIPRYFLLLIVGFSLSAFHWLPILGEKLILHVPLHTDPLLLTPLWQLIFSPWRYGLLHQGPQGELSFAIGYIHLIIILLFCWLIIKNREKTGSAEHVFWLAWLSIIIFLITPLSTELWKFLPLLNQIQFSYRLLIMVNMFSAIVAGFVYTQKLFSQTLWMIILMITVGITALNWGNRGTLANTNDHTLRASIPSSASQEVLLPAIPTWFDTTLYWQKPVENKLHSSDSVSVISIVESNHYHSYKVSALQPTKVTYSLMFYPGWEVLLNTEKIYTKNSAGLLTFIIPEGEHFLEIKYIPNIFQKAGEGLTFFTLLSIPFSWLVYTVTSKTR